jgi:hypothetical protein
LTLKNGDVVVPEGVGLLGLGVLGSLAKRRRRPQADQAI